MTMMKKLLLAFCVLFSVLGNAQTWTHYNPITTSTQLPNNRVNGVTQDKEGVMWFATNYGISSYDGNKWNNILPFNDFDNCRNVSCVVVDSLNNKWFGCSGGLLKFDGQNWTRYNEVKGTKIDNVYSLAYDKNGDIWMGTSSGILKLDSLNLYKWESFIFSNNNLTPYTYISSIVIDNNGNKWFSTNIGVVKYDNTNWTIVKSSNGISFNQLLFDLKRNILWAGTGDGIYRYDGYNWVKYLGDFKYNYYSYNDIGGLSVDFKGNLWVGTYDGVAKFDGFSWTTYLAGYGLASKYVRSIFIDKDGNKWFGTVNGVSKFDDKNWVTYKANGLVDFDLTSISIDARGNKWIGAKGDLLIKDNNGDYLYDGQKGGLYKFNDTIWTNYNKIGVDSYNDNKIGEIKIDAQDNKWLACSGGLVKFEDGFYTLYTKNDGLGGGVFNSINSISIDSKNSIWTNTYDYFTKFDGKVWTSFYNGEYFRNELLIDSLNNKWSLFNRGLLKLEGSNWIYFYDYNLGGGNTNLSYPSSIAIDMKGNIWLADYSILSKYNGKTWENFTFDSLYISKIVTDLQGNIWGAARGQIFKFDGKSLNVFKNNSIGNVKQITIDEEGNKWLSTDNGLFKFSDGGAGAFKIFKTRIGIVFNDLDGNGKKDKNETSLANQIIQIDSNYTTTQNNGLFYTSLKNGTHTFTYRPQANWKLTTDSSIDVTVTNSHNNDTLYFGVQAIANKNEVETKLTGTSTRAGFKSKSWINYTNLGTLAENGTVSYTLADEVNLVQSIPVADSVIGKRLVWKYGNLIPNEKRQINITTQMPGVNFLGDTLVSISKIKSAFSEYNDTLKQVLTGSYDPNDKLVAQGIGSKGYVLFGKELEYTVRFQNTGTDTAFNVNIRDILDLNLDVASLQIVASSHPVKLDLRGQNEAIFRFENIKLPHQKRDDLGSNGFVKYTISPKRNLPENTSVKNKANIYFDFNPAIITNETENTYVSKLPAVVTGIQGFQSNKSASIFPNPAKDGFTIVFPQTGTYEVSLSNIQGKSIKTWNEIIGQETTLSVEGVEPGMYLYTAQGSNGQKYNGKLVVGR
jgi:uncharacterized repeat protein (TIGR01451 family)